ncbi:hypothetical protein WJX72_004805 [[Myrmecia] bisecta]|uniref:TOG domain-containing protein n=1 Tax=[Myrmecia] bisecta TaxID=41462 RepID=A0AAW1Q913_9CHLO
MAFVGDGSRIDGSRTEFGFVPSQIIQDLKDIGNWKVRAVAIDMLHQAVRSVDDTLVLLPTLSKFVQFLMMLLTDPNFKISLSTMQILGDLVAKVGFNIKPYLGDMMPGLIDKLGDNKIVVRQADISVITILMRTLRPPPVLDSLSGALLHDNWRVREEAINIVIQALLTFSKDEMSLGSIFKSLAQALEDSKDRVRTAAVEAMAVLHAEYGTQLQALLASCNLPEATRRQLQERFARKTLPTLNSEGFVEHQVHARPPSAASQQQGYTSLTSPLSILQQREPGSPSRDRSVGKLPFDVPIPRARSASRPRRTSGSMSAQLDQEDVGPSAAVDSRDSLMKRRTSREPPSLNVDSPGSAPRPPGPACTLDRPSPQSLVLKWNAMPPGPAAGHGPTPDSLGAERHGGQQEAAYASGLRGSMDSLCSYPSLHGTDSASGSPYSSPTKPRYMGSLHEALPADKPFSAKRALFPDAPNRPLGHDWSIGADRPAQQSGDNAGASPASSELWRLNWQVGERCPAPVHTGVPARARSAFMMARNREGQLGPCAAPGEAVRRSTGTLPEAVETSGQEDQPACWSPSKAGAKLQTLKRRQQEARRVMSANAVIHRTSSSGSADGLGLTQPASLARASTAQQGQVPHPQSSIPSMAALTEEFGLDPYSRQSSDAWREGSPSTTNRPQGIHQPLRIRKTTAAYPSDNDSPVSSATSSNPLNRYPSSTVDDASSPSTPGGGTPARKRRGSFLGDAQPSTASDEVATEDLQPCSHPEAAMQSVLQVLSQANVAKRKELDWQAQNEALLNARRLVKHHPSCVQAQLHTFVLTVVPSVEALRSITSKNCMMLLQEMFLFMGRALDGELEHVVPTLAKKAGEVSNAGRDTFLACEADKTLAEMVESLSEAKVANALINMTTHKSMHVRAKVASHLDACMQGHHGQRLLANPALLEKVFRTAAGFLEEGSLDTRTFGKRIIWEVKHLLDSQGNDFPGWVSRLPAEVKQHKVWEVLKRDLGPPPPPVKVMALRSPSGSRNGRPGAPGSMFREGLGTPTSMPGTPGTPLRTPPRAMASPPASRTANSGSHEGTSEMSTDGPASNSRHVGRSSGLPGSPAASRRGTADRGMGRAGIRDLRRTGSSTASDAPSDQGRGFIPKEVDPQVADSLANALVRSVSKDWRERGAALTSLADLAPHLPDLPDAQLVSVVDHLTQRLSDGNSKVAIQALEVLCQVFCVLGNHTPSLNTLVPALAANMGSTNEKIRAKAGEAVQTLLGKVDAALLIQNFAHCVSHGNMRGKPTVIEKLDALVDAVYPSKPMLVIKHALPAAFTMLNERGSDIRVATQSLLTTLARHMGDELAQHAMNLSATNKARISEVLALA